ncbi:MAG: hypothetical protein COA37_23280 [Hoeflea sp.]|uniref:hypothetical protein n=1 Tax=Hoeflea sp. TaxID=1940281 RepID=UPI000C0CA287|nr:hypothetical protein [Hoeflea sp.]PHR17030.1 MAG: hypothetical protein COA37_23280 [Hoeflea sp.]
MNTFIRNVLAALVVATAGVAASAPAANAGSVGFELSIGGHGGGIVIRDRDRRGGWNRFEGHRGHRNVCRPHRAVQKARHMGVRRADVIRANNRRVVVQGVRHHRSVRVVFANQRNCPVIRVRR